MRNPAVHLIGIAASPRGGEIFGSRAEEELRQWLEVRLDALGIDPVAYSRFVLSLLRRPDSALSSPEEAVGTGRGIGRRTRARPKAELPLNDDREQRRAVVQCLTSAADNECGIEALVDELCIKLKELEGESSNDEKDESKNDEPKTSLETLTLRDRALRYYAAFPALQSVYQIKKSPSRKDRNIANYFNNKNNGIHLHNNKNNKTGNKNTKMSISIESRRSEDKDSFGFAKSMEQERAKERELEEIDPLKLAQLQSKFNKHLEALWNSAPGNAQNTASIWAAPTFSIPSGPLWPIDTTTETILALSNSDRGNTADTRQKPIVDEPMVDEPPHIPCDIDLISIEDCADECSNKDRPEYKTKQYKKKWSVDSVDWSVDSVMDGLWYWKGIESNLVTMSHMSYNPLMSGFFPVAPCQTSIGANKESRSSLKVNSLPEPDEDLLTSARTHFRPIKDDGYWADGTTFPVNNTLERVVYRRSQSGNLLYLPGGESPYMEYRENDTATPTVSANLTLKFRVRQCDKSVQTDPIRPPVRRRLIFEDDSVGGEQAIMKKKEERARNEEDGNDDDIERDFFPLDQLGWVQSSVPQHNDRKRRHSSCFGYQPLTTLRPLTL